MANKLRIDFPKIQTRLLKSEEKTVMRCLRTCETYSMGPRLKELEDNFAKYAGVKYAAGVNNCTSALELAAMLSGVKAGDEVIIPAHTFTSSALPFLRQRCRLVFADIDEKTFVISLEDLERKISRKTKVIMAVHLYGLMAPMEGICRLAGKCRAVVIEDAAQSPGASINGKKAGSWGKFGCFSFHSQKNITALGEGGMIVTNDKNCYEKILGLRKIGNRPYKNQKKYWQPAMSNVVEAEKGKVPYNFALPEVNAAAANCILSRMDKIAARRAAQAAYIKKSLRDFKELEFQHIPRGYRHAFHLLVARYSAEHSNRDDLIWTLYDRYGIKCVVQYNPLYNYELFRRNGYTAKTCPKSDSFFDNMISFPFWSDMPRGDMEYLVSSVKKSIRSLRR